MHFKNISCKESSCDTEHPFSRWTQTPGRTYSALLCHYGYFGRNVFKVLLYRGDRFSSVSVTAFNFMSPVKFASFGLSNSSLPCLSHPQWPSSKVTVMGQGLVHLSPPELMQIVRAAGLFLSESYSDRLVSKWHDASRPVSDGGECQDSDAIEGTSLAEGIAPGL